MLILNASEQTRQNRDDHMLHLGKRNAFAARYMTTSDSLSGLWNSSIKPAKGQNPHKSKKCQKQNLV